MNAGAVADRVYTRLKSRLLGGELLPGEKLEPVRFADEVGSSVTPVRDAFNRLVGEALIDARASEGFHVPHATEPVLRDRYVWQGALLRQATALWRSEASIARADALPADLAAATVAFFDLFGQRADNDDARDAIGRNGDRLATARVAERLVLTGLEAELHDLAVAFDNEPTASLNRRLARYHRRRIGVVPALVRAMYRRA